MLQILWELHHKDRVQLSQFLHYNRCKTLNHIVMDARACIANTIILKFIGVFTHVAGHAVITPASFIYYRFLQYCLKVTYRIIK